MRQRHVSDVTATLSEVIKPLFIFSGTPDSSDDKNHKVKVARRRLKRFRRPILRMVAGSLALAAIVHCTQALFARGQDVQRSDELPTARWDLVRAGLVDHPALVTDSPLRQWKNGSLLSVGALRSLADAEPRFANAPIMLRASHEKVFTYHRSVEDGPLLNHPTNQKATIPFRDAMELAWWSSTEKETPGWLSSLKDKSLEIIRWLFRWLRHTATRSTSSSTSGTSQIYVYCSKAIEELPSALAEILPMHTLESLVVNDTRLTKAPAPDLLDDLNVSDVGTIFEGGELWIGSAGVAAAPHYDLAHNLFVMLSGEKSFALYPPAAHEDLSIYPYWHGSHRQVQRCDVNTTPERAGVVVVTIRAGDVLYVPPMWFHRVESLSHNSGFNVWSSSLEANTPPLIPPP